MNNTKQNIYVELKIQFLKKGLTNQDVAKMAGIKPTTFSHRMTGKSPWTVPEMIAVAPVIALPESKFYETFVHPYLVARGMAEGDRGCA